MSSTAFLATEVGAFYTYSGFWLSVLMCLLMYVNALRTFLNPSGFSLYMGLAVSDAISLAWVRVYGLRALFIGMVVTYFTLRLDPGSLKWISAFAVTMAVGDAWLVKSIGGSTVSRHLFIAAVLVVATIAISDWHQEIL